MLLLKHDLLLTLEQKFPLVSSAAPLAHWATSCLHSNRFNKTLGTKIRKRGGKSERHL